MKYNPREDAEKLADTLGVVGEYSIAYIANRLEMAYIQGQIWEVNEALSKTNISVKELQDEPK